MASSKSQTQQKLEDWAEAVKDRLVRAMKAKGISQRDLGEAAGVTGSAIAQRVGREGSCRDWWALYRIVEALGNISADELLGLKPATGVAPVDRRLMERALKKARSATRDGAASVEALRAALGNPEEP